MQIQALAISRRRFFTRTAVAVGIASITAFGFSRLPVEVETAVPTMTGKDKILADFVVLDSHYSTSGKARIAARFSNGTPARRKSAIEWIVRRKHANMYDLVCHCLQDGDMEVRLYAASALSILDPVTLKPHMVSIAEAQSSCKGQDFKRQLAILLRNVETS